MISINKLVIFPFLFSIIPIILLYYGNIDEVPVTELTTPLILTLLVIFPLFIILNFILKSGTKVGIIVTFLVAIFFSYGHIFNMLQDTPLFYLDLVHQKYVLIPFMIVLPVGIYYLIKTKKDLTKLRSFFNVISIVMISFMFFNIGVFHLENDSNMDEFYKFSFENELEGISFENESTANKTFPDIYHIVLDEYTNDKVLLEDFQFDNSEFIGNLLNSNFFIPSNPLSNYPNTEPFLSSTLNMKYLEEKNLEKYNRLETEKRLSDNYVMKFLKQNGYSIVIPYSGYGPADKFYETDSHPCSDVLFLQNRFLTELSRTTILNYFVEKQIENERRSIQLCTLSELQNITEKYDEPVYVFAHIFIPHAPYLFDKDGNPVAPQSNKLRGLEGWKNTDGYLNEIQFVNKKMINITTEILSQPEESIIIIQGDTGTTILNNPDVKDYVKKRFSILYAVHIPSDDKKIFSDNISSVNTYRIIFNNYFGTNLEILDNRHYWFPDLDDKIHGFTDVTEIVNSSET